jgi:hypothetical protein
MQQPATASGLLEQAEFDAVTFTVMDNNLGMARSLAERIVVEALAFVVTCARNPKAPIAPSRTVDEGWHALVLHTAVYARLCDRLGVFVHHYPERPHHRPRTVGAAHRHPHPGRRGLRALPAVRSDPAHPQATVGCSRQGRLTAVCE